VAVSPEYGNPFSDHPRLVVGVAADFHGAGLSRPAPPTVFVPINQTPDNTMAFVNKLFLTSMLIRTGDSGGISERVRTAVASADPDLALASLRPLSQVVVESLAGPRFYASITSAFGLVAVVLTTIGLYGLLRYRLDRRTREIAVRMALGASRATVVTLVAREAAQLVSVGLVLGIAGSFLLKRFLVLKVYGLDGSIATSVLSAAVLMMMVATLTSILTAFRAASIQPTAVLRNE
jgi:ABC-type antimicrobial peptide transport system permease subunit